MVALEGFEPSGQPRYERAPVTNQQCDGSGGRNRTSGGHGYEPRLATNSLPASGPEVLPYTVPVWASMRRLESARGRHPTAQSLVPLPGLEPGLSALRGRRVGQLHYSGTWWTRRDSNSHRAACKADMFPLAPRAHDSGGSDGNRTRLVFRADNAVATHAAPTPAGPSPGIRTQTVRGLKPVPLPVGLERVGASGESRTPKRLVLSQPGMPVPFTLAWSHREDSNLHCQESQSCSSASWDTVGL